MVANGVTENLFSVLAASNQPAFFTEDLRLAVGQGAFNWPPMSLAYGGVLTTNALENYLANFQLNARAWPAFISSAFPRFHDIFISRPDWVTPTAGSTTIPG